MTREDQIKFGMLGAVSKPNPKIVGFDKKRKYEEDTNQKLFIMRFKALYPSVHIRTDTSGKHKQGRHLNAQQAENSGRGFPDVVIYASRGGYSGCLLESKKPGVNPILKSGKLSVNEHFREQYEVQLELRAENYYTAFVSTAELMEYATRYMDGNPIPMVTVANYKVSQGLSDGDEFFKEVGI
jgi:hypothetical protein